jgi:hypothetical protein
LPAVLWYSLGILVIFQRREYKLAVRVLLGAL